MSYTLDDAHEALSLIHYELGNTVVGDASPAIREAVISAFCQAGHALFAIEAQLPPPCPDCGSDSDWSPFPCSQAEVCMRCFRAQHKPEWVQTGEEIERTLKASK